MRSETFPLDYMFGFRFKIILGPVQPFQSRTECLVQYLKVLLYDPIL